MTVTATFLEIVGGPLDGMRVPWFKDQTIWMWDQPPARMELDGVVYTKTRVKFTKKEATYIYEV